MQSDSGERIYKEGKINAIILVLQTNKTKQQQSWIEGKLLSQSSNTTVLRLSLHTRIPIISSRFILGGKPGMSMKFILNCELSDLCLCIKLELLSSPPVS